MTNVSFPSLFAGSDEYDNGYAETYIHNNIIDNTSV